MIAALMAQVGSEIDRYSRRILVQLKVKLTLLLVFSINMF